jgi:hypothetical protein
MSLHDLGESSCYKASLDRLLRDHVDILEAEALCYQDPYDCDAEVSPQDADVDLWDDPDQEDDSDEL